MIADGLRLELSLHQSQVGGDSICIHLAGKLAQKVLIALDWQLFVRVWSEEARDEFAGDLRCELYAL